MNERKAPPVFSHRSAVPTRPTGSMPSGSVLFTAAANIVKQAQGLTTSSTTTGTNNGSTSGTSRSSGPSYAIVRFSLVNTEEFTAKADGPVSKKVVDVLKRIQGTRYDPTTKRVIFPLEAHDSLQVRHMQRIIVSSNPFPGCSGLSSNWRGTLSAKYDRCSTDVKCEEEAIRYKS